MRLRLLMEKAKKSLWPEKTPGAIEFMKKS